MTFEQCARVESFTTSDENSGSLSSYLSSWNAIVLFKAGDGGPKRSTLWEVSVGLARAAFNLQHRTFKQPKATRRPHDTGGEDDDLTTPPSHH
jgi:hypothetical protein